MASLAATYASSMHAQRSPCCQTGYPVMADPLTGRTVCSCQLHTGVPSYLARVPRLPETHFINSDVSQYKMMAADRHTRMYRAPLQGGHIPHPYDAALMTSHPYAAMYPGFDINGIRRKNATRESTSALKAWLFEHRKNPYPTKAEKVMLAIVCQMTLTQVSTWFANARRRLKKERKAGDSDIDLDDIDVDDKKSVNDDTYDSDSMTNNTDNSRSLTDASDVSDVEEQTIVLRNPAKKCVQRLFSPDSRNELFLERLSSPADLKNSSTMSSTAVSPLTFAVVSSPLVSSIPSSDSTATISTSAVSPTISSLVGKTVKESGSGSKPKIWSIESIISG